MKSVRLFVLAIVLLALSSSVYAQNIDWLQKARQCIAEGDCDRAQENYNAYKLSGKTDKEIERLLEECQKPPKEDPSKPKELQLYNGRYVGETANGKPHGTGILYYNNGDRYEGFFENGDLQHGTFIFANGDKYEGAFKNGKADGYGVLTKINGQVTEGFWENGNYKKNNEINDNDHFVPKEEPKPRPEFNPEDYTVETEIICGPSFGMALNYTAFHALLGVGADLLLFAPKHTATTTLVNSGYNGNFTKTTTTKLSGFCMNVFFTPGVYFKYFSVSCQVGWLYGHVDRFSQYDGWGYGLLDGDLDEYWGSYEQRSFSNTTSYKAFNFTLTPQVKGYIPIGKLERITIGLGYSFIPSLDYYGWLSGSLGINHDF